MMAKVRAAEQALLDGKFSILNSSPLGRAQVERFAALNARIQELESMRGLAPAKVPVVHKHENAQEDPLHLPADVSYHSYSQCAWSCLRNELCKRLWWVACLP